MKKITDHKIYLNDTNHAEDESALPCIFLSDTCDVIKVSEKFRSCHYLNVDRTSLIDIMSDSDFEILMEFTSTRMSRRQKNNDDTHLFHIKLANYRYALARKLRDTNENITVLYLAENYSDIIKLDMFSNERIPLKIRDMLKNLSEETDIIGVGETAGLIRCVLNKLADHRDIMTSEITFSENYFSPTVSSPHGVGIPTEALVILLVSLISVLDSASTSAKISINITYFSDSFDLHLETEAATVPPLPGKTCDILSLAKHIPQSYINLAVAEYVAAENTIMLSMRSPESGNLRFSVGYIPDTIPTLEFKYASFLSKAEQLTERTINMLYSMSLSADKQ